VKVNAKKKKQKIKRKGKKMGKKNRVPKDSNSNLMAASSIE
jgi:hypothetical protein